MKKFERIWQEIKNAENVDVYIGLVISTAISILGLATGDLTQKIFSAILLVLGFISGILLINNRINQKIKEILEQQYSEFNSSIVKAVITENNEAIIRALNGVSVSVYKNPYEYSQYKIKRLHQAKRIDDVTWRFHGYESQTSSKLDRQAYQKEDEIIKEVVRKSDVVWREVAVFRSKAHLEHELSLIQNPENVSYNLGYYPITDTIKSPPRFGFMIIDNNELFIGYASTSHWLVIRHSEIIALYSAYFTDIWKNSEKLYNDDEKKIEQLKTMFD